MERDSTTHTARTRAAHWANALIVIFLLWSGFAIFGSDRDFAAITRLLPQFFHSLHLGVGKRQLFTLHTYAGAFFALNGVLYVASLLITGAWKRIVPKGRQWAHDASRPLAYSMPQRLAYSSILAGAVVMVVTGLALWFKHQLPWLIAALGGQHVVLPVHVVLATGLLGFIAVHVTQVILAGATTFRSMTVGNDRPVTAPQVNVRRWLLR